MGTRTVHERAEALRAEGTPFVHARVVLAERPTSAKPGDEALVLPDGTIEGFVGGQCAQATLRSVGLAAIESGGAVLLRISPTPEPEQAGKTIVHNPCLSGGTLEIFMEPVLPAPTVGVIGDAPIAQALARVGAVLGYEVGPWSLGLMRTTDAVVVASHGFDEEQALVDALTAGIPYVGLVASPKRGRAVLESLAVDESLKARVHTPAGLDIGARTAEEIAVSIFAEIIKQRDAPHRIRSLPLLTEQSATAIDPICGMSVAAVESSIHADVDGTRWYFCCPGCRSAFLADPSAHDRA